MDINNLLFTCEHPKTIRTKDGRTMVVSCGHCLSCIVQKQHSKSNVCAQQEKISKYTFFVTLTYNKENIPCAYPLYLFDDARRRQYIELYDEDSGEFLGSCYYPHRKCEAIIRRTDDKKLHYARYSDVQKFLKRLRRKIETSKKIYNNEKIKYYSVSEYGPRTFRPHFHILLYFDSPELSQDLAALVHQSWKNGYCFTTLSKGHVTSYVASYVNSVTSLPPIFQTSSTNPKCSHSSRLALPLFTQEFKKIYKYEPERLVRSIEHRDSYGNVSYSAPWCSYKTYLFPKCQGYAYKSVSERYATYNLLSTIGRYYGKRTVSEYAEIIMTDSLNGLLPKRIADPLLKNVDGTYIVPTLDILKQRIYQLKHYDKLCKEFDITPLQLSNIIQRFYSALDYANLKEMYEVIQESEHTMQPEDYELFSKVYVYQSHLLDDDVNVDGIVFESSLLRVLYRNSPMYQGIVSSRKLSYQKSIKHKVLNDLNNIFL